LNNSRYLLILFGSCLQRYDLRQSFQTLSRLLSLLWDKARSRWQCYGYTLITKQTHSLKVWICPWLGGIIFWLTLSGVIFLIGCFQNIISIPNTFSTCYVVQLKTAQWPTDFKEDISNTFSLYLMW